MMNHTPPGRKMRRKMPVQFILRAISHGRDPILLGDPFLRKLSQTEGEGSGLTPREVRWHWPLGLGFQHWSPGAHPLCGRVGGRG